MRLELRTTNVAISILQFQFHKGAIRTREEAKNIYGAKLFQFHKGAIRTLAALLAALCPLVSIP